MDNLAIFRHCFSIAVVIGLLWGCFIAVFPDYILWHPLWVIGLVSIPFTLSTGEHGNQWMVIFAFLLTGMFALLVKTPYGLIFFGFSGLMLIVSKTFGKTSLIPFVIIIVISPVFDAVSGILSLPLRLKLSEVAGGLFAAAGFPVQISGNLIELNGNAFMIDPACAGIFMLKYSLLFGALMMAIREKSSNHFSLIQILLRMTVLIILILVTNLLRIITLVIFNIPEQSIFHDAAGIVNFIVYTLIPFYFICGLHRNKVGISVYPDINTVLPSAIVFQQPVKQYRTKSLIQYAALTILPFVFFCFSGNGQATASASYEDLHFDALSGFPVTKRADGTISYSNADALVYIKPPVSPFRSHHDPTICWRGSGYTFETVTRQKFGTHEIYVATMDRKGAKLYTAWWFQKKDPCLSG
jgi:exosortase N